MTCTSIVYNNKISDIDTFIDYVLKFNIKAERIPISDIKEYSDYYSININPFYQNLNFFEIYYKNCFLILQIKDKNSSLNTLATKLFYLPNIDTKKISHVYYNDSLSLKIPKIYFNNF